MVNMLLVLFYFYQLHDMNALFSRDVEPLYLIQNSPQGTYSLLSFEIYFDIFFII